MLPWMVMSPRTRVAAGRRRLPDRRESRDEERNADLGLKPVIQEVDYLDVKVRRVDLAADAEIGLAGEQVAEGPIDGLFGHPARCHPPAFSLPVPAEMLTSIRNRPTVPSPLPKQCKSNPEASGSDEIRSRPPCSGTPTNRSSPVSVPR